MELFESTIENVSDIEIKGYSDPDGDQNLEIWAKSGGEEYIYKFHGPGVKKVNITANRLENLFQENEKLKIEKEEHVVSAVAAKEKNKMMEIENEKLKKELHSLKHEKTNIPKTPSSRSDILKAAEKCVCGQREQDYGTPESNFQLIADLWNAYLGFMEHPRWQQIRATDVAMMMALMKIARIRNGGGSGDSFVDLAGYAACGGEIWDGERHK